MNRRNLFRFLGALPLLAIAPKNGWGPLNPNPHPLLLDGVIKYQTDYIAINQRAKYRWVSANIEKPTQEDLARLRKRAKELGLDLDDERIITP